MANLAERYKPLVYKYRAFAGERGFRTHTVKLVTTSEHGTHTGDGDADETETAITEANAQSPKVRWLNDEEIAVGGYAGRGVVEIGPITPAFSGGGTNLNALMGVLERRDTVQIEITGPMHPTGMRYVIISALQERPLRIMIRARPADGGAWT